MSWTWVFEDMSLPHLYVNAGQDDDQQEGEKLARHMRAAQNRRIADVMRLLSSEHSFARPLVRENRVHTLNRAHRLMWVGLVLLSLVVGVLAGASFTVEDYWLAPSTALFVILGVLTLAATLFALGEGRGRHVSERRRP